MFTGIIEEVGTVSSIRISGQSGRIAVHAEVVTSGVKLGDSIAINGVCLTVVEFSARQLAFDVSAETLARSTLGRLSSGRRVNLERALQASDRLGGHIVQGHVDSSGRFISRREVGDSVLMRFGFPDEIARYICLKGSIAIEGISLTVACLNDDWFEVAVIPHTLKVTTLGDLQSDDEVNLEADIIAKYLERLLQTRTEKRPSLTMEGLREMGY